MRTLLAVALALLPVRVWAGACADPSDIPLVQASFGPIPAGGGVVLVMGPSNDWQKHPKDEPLDAVKARLVQGKTTIPLKLEVLAPGVGRLVPDVQPGQGNWRLDGLDGAAVTFGAATPLPAAPNVKGMKWSSGTYHDPRGGNRSWEAAGIELGADIPPRVAGVILYGSADRPLKFAGFTSATTGRSIPIPTQGYRCAPPIYGQTPVKGMKVTFRWLTSDGRLSDKSAVVTVK
jgi:hypothetical protein